MKRGSEFKIVELNTQIGEELSDDKSLTQLSGALDELAQHDPPLAELVDLKYFCASHSPTSQSCVESRNAPCSATGKRCACCSTNT